MTQSPVECQITSADVALCVQSVRELIRCRDVSSPPHQRAALLNIPPACRASRHPTMAGRRTGLTEPLGRAYHSVTSSAPPQCHSVTSSGTAGTPYAPFYIATCLATCRYEKNYRVTHRTGLARQAALSWDIGLRSDRLRKSRCHLTLEATCQAQRSSLPPARVRA